jgi:hypothetical protein
MQAADLLKKGKFQIDPKKSGGRCAGGRPSGNCAENDYKNSKMAVYKFIVLVCNGVILFPD